MTDTRSPSGLCKIPAGIWGGGCVSPLMIGIMLGSLATPVAHTAPADLRGTAYGMFDRVSGLAMLAAGVLAGLLWGKLSAAAFHAGAVFCLLALGLLAMRGKSSEIT